MRARIVWKTKDQGGRSSPPVGLGKPPYSTIVRFADTPLLESAAVIWSLVIEMIPELSTEYVWMANVRYLSSEAPAQELVAGRRFELYEGRRCVAEGQLLPVP